MSKKTKKTKRKVVIVYVTRIFSFLLRYVIIGYYLHYCCSRRDMNEEIRKRKKRREKDNEIMSTKIRITILDIN